MKVLWLYIAPWPKLKAKIWARASSGELSEAFKTEYLTMLNLYALVTNREMAESWQSMNQIAVIVSKMFRMRTDSHMLGKISNWLYNGLEPQKADSRKSLHSCFSSVYHFSSLFQNSDALFEYSGSSTGWIVFSREVFVIFKWNNIGRIKSIFAAGGVV